MKRTEDPARLTLRLPKPLFAKLTAEARSKELSTNAFLLHILYQRYGDNFAEDSTGPTERE